MAKRNSRNDWPIVRLRFLGLWLRFVLVTTCQTIGLRSGNCYVRRTRRSIKVAHSIEPFAGSFALRRRHTDVFNCLRYRTDELCMLYTDGR